MRWSLINVIPKVVEEEWPTEKQVLFTGFNKWLNYIGNLSALYPGADEDGGSRRKEEQRLKRQCNPRAKGAEIKWASDFCTVIDKIPNWTNHINFLYKIPVLSFGLELVRWIVRPASKCANEGLLFNLFGSKSQRRTMRVTSSGLPRLVAHQK